MKRGTADCRSAIFLQPITHPARHQELLVRIARPARFAANAACLGIRSPAMCLCHQLTNSTPFSARGRLLAQTPGGCEMCIGDIAHRSCWGGSMAKSRRCCPRGRVRPPNERLPGQKNRLRQSHLRSPEGRRKRWLFVPCGLFLAPRGFHTIFFSIFRPPCPEVPPAARAVGKSVEEARSTIGTARPGHTSLRIPIRRIRRTCLGYGCRRDPCVPERNPPRS